MNKKQQGMIFLDAIVGVFIFSIAILSGVQLYFLINQQFYISWYQYKASIMAHSLLEGYPISYNEHHKMIHSSNWAYQFELTMLSSTCVNVTVNVMPPIGRIVSLSRWYC